MSTYDKTFIAIDGINGDHLDEDGVSTLISGIHDAVLEDTDRTPQEVGAYAPDDADIDTIYVGITGFTQDALTDQEGRELTEHVFTLLREDLGLVPTETALIVDGDSEMSDNFRELSLLEH